MTATPPEPPPIEDYRTNQQTPKPTPVRENPDTEARPT